MRFLPLKSQFVLTGNVRDLQIQVDGEKAYAASLADVLSDALGQARYADIIRYEPVSGFSNLTALASGRDPETALTRLGLTPSNGKAAGSIDLLANVLQRQAELDGQPLALIVDFASRLVVRSDALSATGSISLKP